MGTKMSRHPAQPKPNSYLTRMAKGINAHLETWQGGPPQNEFLILPPEGQGKLRIGEDHHKITVWFVSTRNDIFKLTFY